jgi:predicted DNA binding CopG/RHH family protein
MSKIKFDEFEQELLDTYENDEFESILMPERKNQLMQMAHNTFRQDKRINIKISVRDWDAIQRRALEEGIPSQALVASIVHKYVSGSFYDITANKLSKAG